jgi:hypothetical protein
VLELLAIERDEEQGPMLVDRLLGSEKPTEWSLVSEGVDRELRFENVSLQFISSGQTVVGDLCIGPTWATVAKPLDR